jgi:hypothetical protein
MRLNYWKLGLIFFVGLYFFYYAFTPEQWNFIDSANLLVHEAGHWIFSFFGQTLYVAGGSILQILIPCLFAAYFFGKKEIYSASIVLFWVGQNILNVASYAGDAIKMQLPLLGGNENVIHDWNFLLTRFQWLNNAEQISGGMKTLGILIFISAIFLGVKACLNEQKKLT